MTANAPVRIRVLRLRSGRQAPLPVRATPHASGFDLRALLSEDLVIRPRERAAVPTGLAVEIPVGFEGQVRPRSGLAIHQGLTVVNAPGTIDSDYRGEVKVLLINLGEKSVTIRSGDRIAQLVVHRLPEVEWEEADELEPTRRGAGGFGHTGER